LTKGLKVSKVQRESVAAEMEIEPGDVIFQVDNQEIVDILDLHYHTSDREFTLLIEKKNKEIWKLEITMEPGEILGLEVSSVSATGLKKCNNNCIFCFVKQMPLGMRKSLYDRDDDYRLSVTQGSYITLSNLSSTEFRRILDFHISPLYISVHAWDSDIRKGLMRNPLAGKLPEQIEMLAEIGTTLHTQIVLVPGYNDGKVLEETVNKLARYYPAVQSIGIVPVGLTKYRAGLTKLRTITSLEAQKNLELGRTWQRKFKNRTGKNLVYFSDEFYVLAECDFPQISEYDDFPQLENGIGMAAKLHSELALYSSYLPKRISSRRIHIVTGVSASGFFRFWAGKLAPVKGLEIIVHKIVNNFFGSTVTVAGLLTAQDIAAQLGDLQGEYFLIPKVMLKADERIFLDGYDIFWLEQRVNGKIVVIENNGKAFLEGVLGRELEVLDN
jgi:putative radical SAM enzyme (TIGR03279 family)